MPDWKGNGEVLTWSLSPHSTSVGALILSAIEYIRLGSLPSSSPVRSSKTEQTNKQTINTQSPEEVTLI